ncbi:hybrid sensor histidine kinase/response regulator [Desulfatitalea tepidiphila]|uniref:hybrid sensor histidine kinase/response regulator n=1 Tax=Desulfatitalea tepidiphila TaxID=1185843 RepID=UPI0006B5A4CB|nr:PAS domain-containing sensor histidine kinase [Desulfatitalea tepidiphila]
MPANSTIQALERRIAELELELKACRAERGFKLPPTVPMSTDITERVSAEQKYRQSEDRFRQVFLTSPDAINLNRVEDGRYIDINEGFTALMGYTREDVLGKTSVELGIWHNPEDRRRLLSELKAQGHVKELEARFVRKSGEVGVGLMSARILRFDGEDVILSITRDITDRKAAEDALRESEEKYRLLVEHAGEAIFIAQGGMLRFVNRRTEQLSGYTSEELVAKPFQELVHPDDRALVVDHHFKRLKGIKMPPRYSFRIVDRSGVARWVELNAVLIEWQGQPATLNFLHDITGRKQAEEEKARIESQYRQFQKVEAIGRLAGGVAHDLNNLLTPIIGYSELLSGDLALGDLRRDSIQQILRAAYGARDLVHQLLAFSRKQTLKYQPLDLNKIVQGFEKLLRRTIREDIDLRIVVPPDIRTIMGDIGQIEQVLMNLFVNAQQAMPQGGRLAIETALVTLDAAYAAAHHNIQPGRYVMLAVSDTGRGMDQETLEHIFEPFFSTKGDQGTGLGLATVYGIVKQHGGHVWVYSEVGKGSTFKVYLPVSEQTPAESAAQKEAESFIQGSETILLAEDNDQVRILAEAVLKRQGYTVLVADRGAEALNLLKAHTGKVDLLLTDVVMPDMNGKALFEKAVAVQPGLKVLYMSGYTDDVIASRGVLDEGVRFIQKPFTVRALAAKVREVLEGKMHV